MKAPEKIEEFQYNGGLDELYQKSGLRFAFLSAPKDGSKICHPFVKCRDFLQDMVRATLLKKPIYIYGLNFNPAENPKIDMRRIRMAVRQMDEKVPAHELGLVMIRFERLARHYEQMANISSKTSVVRYSDNTFVISGPKFWLRSPVLLTFYTLLVRLCEKNIKIRPGFDTSVKVEFDKVIAENKDDADVTFLKEIRDFIPALITKTEEIVSEGEAYDPIYTKDMSINDFHNYSGIVSLCTNRHSMNALRHKRLLAVKGQMENVKELLRIKTHYIGPYESYEPHHLEMSFVAGSGDESIIVGFTRCRETYLSNLRTFIKSKSFDKQDKFKFVAKVPGVGYSLHRVPRHKKEFVFAKNVLNYYEKLMGMPETKLSTIVMTNGNQENFAWVFEADKAWIEHPVLISSFALIIRAAKLYMYNVMQKVSGFTEFEDITDETVSEMWKLLASGKTIAGYTTDKMLDPHKDTFKDILIKRASILEKSDLANSYYINGIGQQIYSSTLIGVHSLIGGNYPDKRVAKAFLKEIKGKS